MPDIPETLDQLSDQQLSEYEAALVAEFDELYGQDDLTAETVARLNELTEAIEAARGEITQREEAVAAQRAAADELAARVRPAEASTGDGGEEDQPGGGESENGGDEEQPNGDEEHPEGEDEAPAETTPEAIAASGRTTVPAQVRRTRRLNVPLSEVQRRAPQVDVGAHPQATITASADVPGFSTGGRINDLEHLREAVFNRSRSLPVTAQGDDAPMHIVASIQRSFRHNLGKDSTPEQIDEVMRLATDPQALVAAGGWCAPSQIEYGFFNIACDDGLLDLPSVGIQRGGLQFPSSPSIADVMGNIWTWTEANDIDAITGSGTKPCVRATCPDFTNKRLECYGLCVTAGNLTDEAYPELNRNFISLMVSAHLHVMNTIHIASLVAASDVAVTGAGAAQGVVAPLLGNVGLQAVDYREKYRMCENDILEVVLPRWAKEAARADLARRNGVMALAVSDAEIMDWFDRRNVRAQFVTDWQLGAGDFPGQTEAADAWPGHVSFLMYAAGTHLLGNGPRIDLGVTRDSVLNATNDHTAAWTEECHLIATRGHESRLVTVPICPDGTTGGNVDLACPIA